MSLTAMVDDLAGLLTGLTPAPVLVGAAVPTRTADLPAVVLEVAEADEPQPGLGRRPATAVSGALAVTDEIDLADPRIVFADGVADLLSGDRRTLAVPRGPVVRADGTTTPPFAATDFAVTVAGTSRPVVDGTPTGAQVALRAEEGLLDFATALPATGTVELAYHVGLWEVRTARHRGRLDVGVYAATVDVIEALSRQVEERITPPAGGLLAVQAVRLGPVAPAAALDTGLLRTLSFRIDHERVNPVVGGAGGVIREVHAEAQPFPHEEVVVRRRSTS